MQKNISVGNVTIVRDFTDVRDVVRGYHFILQKGVSGEVYNICSGNGIAITDLIDLFRQISGTNPEVSIDTSLLRPVENPNVVGSFRKLQNDTAWKPEIALKDSLTEMYNFWLENEFTA
jgi:GDP-4-dehydro-6-deoxy-D-mannose reductase